MDQTGAESRFNPLCDQLGEELRPEIFIGRLEYAEVKASRQPRAGNLEREEFHPNVDKLGQVDEKAGKEFENRVLCWQSLCELEWV